MFLAVQVPSVQRTEPVDAASMLQSDKTLKTVGTSSQMNNDMAMTWIAIQTCHAFYRGPDSGIMTYLVLFSTPRDMARDLLGQQMRRNQLFMIIGRIITKYCIQNLINICWHE